MIRYTIFIVDDERSIREGISTALDDQYHVEAFSKAETAIRAMEKAPPDLILLDIGLPGMDGIAALREIKDIYPEILIIMITAYEDINTVVSAMKLGAHDYVVKPIHMEGLEVTIQNALETVRLRKEVAALQDTYLRENLPCFIGQSEATQDIMDFINTVAKSPDTPILIFGETGTGKELLASAIHYRSPNFKGPFAPVNCAAIPKDLVESELFGYEKGAFSGASPAGKRGLIEEAANGTLFLDEIGDLSFEAQAKLLRFLEEGEFYRVGGTKKLRVRTRVVSATNKDLSRMIDDGLFRKDLYFRLAVVEVKVPSLNERPDDIIPIAKHFLLEFSRKFGKYFTGISPQAETALKGHNWIGNVRELKNLIERGVLIGQGPELTHEDLGLTGVGHEEIQRPAESEKGFPALSSEGIDLPSIQNDLEMFYIKTALKMAQGNESKAARLLNVNHHTFRYRRRRLGIT
jgi:two-component system response regulator AtoC